MKIIIAIFLIFWISIIQAQDVSIVSSQYSLSKQEAISIFRFNDFIFSDGTKVKMFVLPKDHITTREFAYQIGMTSTRFHEKADQAFSSGRLNLLVVANSDRDVVRLVTKTEGAIGYVQDYFIINQSGIPTIIRLR